MTAPRIMSPNGRLPATLPARIKRACVLAIRKLAARAMWLSQSERYASEAKPEESRALLRIKPVQTTKRGQVCYMLFGPINILARDPPEPRMARALIL